MKKAKAKAILQNIRNNLENNMLDSIDNIKIARKINSEISYIVDYLYELIHEIQTISAYIDKKEFLNKMCKLLLENNLHPQEKTPNNKKRALQHFLSGYLYSRVDNEIAEIERKINELNSIIKASQNTENVIQILKNTYSSNETKTLLMQKLNFSEQEAQYLCSKMTLKNFVSHEQIAKAAEQVKYLSEIKSLLIQFKE
ncbi:hypothetical protein AGMMS50262_00420 [Bacteroidia bacterium]|nr:hypothetical protein AGMMS50262_00420 [Bacteroidia bacterium]